MPRTNYWLSFSRLSVIALCLLMGLSISRLLLVAILSERVTPTGGTGFILLQGLRFDAVLLAYLVGPMFVLKPWLHTSRVTLHLARWIIPFYMAVVTALIFFIEASTLPFIGEFDSRPNYIFVEYLNYPREVFSMLLASHPAKLISTSLIALLLAVAGARWMSNDPAASLRVKPLACVLATPLVLGIVLLMGRSTLGHKPINPGVASFSQDLLVNELALNSPYSALYAIYEQRREAAARAIQYGEMDSEELVDLVLTEAGITSEASLSEATPSLHHQVATMERERPLNLVIVLQESMGAEFVGRLGAEESLTPELDRLADDGIWFEQLYATGTRSARGVEAVITGFTPTAHRSVIKLGDVQGNFFTIARLLQRHGYQTSFIYGGESHFDNMRRFTLNNGFQTVVDQYDYDDPMFISSWGVSDEDLFNRAHERFSASDGQPFFSLVFTSSNHSPFDFPAGRVTGAEQGTRAGAVKYADHALGQFIHAARTSDYWDDTIFLVVADHAAGGPADGAFPLNRFQIPGLILGGPIEPRRVPGITSQIDLLPTMLSLLGVSSNHPGIGRDLTRPEYAQGSGRALMQYFRLQAYMEPGRIAVLTPDMPPATYRVTATDELEPLTESNGTLERKALAHALWGPMMIENKAYVDYPLLRLAREPTSRPPSR